MGAGVGADVGAGVGTDVGADVAAGLGAGVGADVGAGAVGVGVVAEPDCPVFEGRAATCWVRSSRMRCRSRRAFSLLGLNKSTWIVS